MNALAQVIVQGGGGAWTAYEIGKAVIIIAAIIGIVLVALRVFGVTLPPWLVQIIVIVVVAACAIFALRLLFAM